MNAEPRLTLLTPRVPSRLRTGNQLGRGKFDVDIFLRPNQRKRRRESQNSKSELVICHPHPSMQNFTLQFTITKL